MNLVVLMGRLTKDTELSFLPGSGTAKCNLTLAVDRKFKKDGQKEADFINCIAFGKTAEIIAQYFVKGSKIAITGEIRTGSYEAKDGTRRYTTDVIIDRFEFVEKNNKESANDEFLPVDGDIPFN
jgi:single stranded DNA-binding protein (ssb)